MDNPIDIVISRYNESLDFLSSPPFVHPRYRIIVYNKGAPMSSLQTKHFYKYVELQNVGKCDHTYLYHIIHNYDTLATLTLFLPGSCMSVEYKRVKTIQTIQTMMQTNTTTFFGFFIPGLASIETFQLNAWSTSNRDNHNMNQEQTLVPAQVRPFGAWHRSMFGDDKELNFICYNGIFAVHKQDILQHKKCYYQRFLNQVDNISNPEAGHYLERSWVTIFGPLSVLSLHIFMVPNE